MIALDANLLVYAHRSGYAEHVAALRAVEKARGSRRGWGIPASAAAEFYSVVTHPASVGRPSGPEEAQAFLESLRDAGAKVLYPREGFVERLMQVASDLGIKGRRIFDLQIALTAFESGASEIWTHNRNFVSLPGLPARDPL